MANNPKTMHVVSDTLLINAMPTEVFEAVASPNKPFLTSNPFTHLEIVGSQRLGNGTTYHWRFTLPLGIRFQFDEVAIEWIEPERFCYRAISGWEMEATNQITPENDQTRITFHLRYQLLGIWNRLIPAWFVRLGIRQSLQNLKRSVEPTERKTDRKAFDEK